MDDKKFLGDKGEKGRNDAKALEADSQSNSWKLTCVSSKNNNSRVVNCTDLLPWLWPLRRRARVEDLLEKEMPRQGPQEVGIPWDSFSRPRGAFSVLHLRSAEPSKRRATAPTPGGYY